MQNVRYFFVLFFILIPLVLCLIDQGFSLDGDVPPPKIIESTTTLYLVNAGFGLLAGLTANFKRKIVFGLTGIFSGLSLTAVSLLYMGWRMNMIKLELVVMLALGLLPAILVYKLLDKLIPARKDAVKQ